LNPPAIVIPRLEVLDELGRGSHSVVYRARREGRYYALKLPLYGETGAKAKLLGERFRREAIALARVRHRALPAVMEVGQAGRIPYIIMELAAGETLASRLLVGPLLEAQAMQLARQLADALGAIHRSGLVHRDVKPKNILFDPQTTAVRLVDFGFAASADARLRIEAPAGTLAYMAPEQLGGLRERVDSRADLYSLGCVLFEALTGSPPFPDLDPRRLFHQHAGHSAPNVLDVDAGVSRGFSGVIAWLLARDPDERCPSAEALTDELNRVEEGSGSRVSRPTQQVPFSIGVGPLVPLIGRDRELDRLRNAWLELHASGGRIFWLKGPAGGGKTRLVEALLDDAARSKRATLVATCKAGDPQPFSTVRQLIESHLSTIEALGGGEKLRMLVSLRRLAGDIAPFLCALSPTLAHAFSDEAPLSRFEDAERVHAEGLAAFLSRLLNDIEPSLLFVDNVHWLDSGSRRVLARVAARMSQTETLAVFAVRSDAASTTDAQRFMTGLPAEIVSELTLGALNEESTHTLVQAYLGHVRVSAELLHAAASLSDGLPLATLEVVRAMLDAAALVPSWGTWRLDREVLDEMRLPGEIVAILARRLDTLDDLTRSALQAAAVIGMEFDDDVLPLTCGLEEGHVHAALAEGRRALLIEAAPRSSHRFVHDSVREALLHALSDVEMRGLHQKAAEAMDQLRAQSPQLGSSHVEVQGDQGVLAHATGSFDRGPRFMEPREFSWRFALATHYAAGQVEKNASRVFETNVEAGRLAFRAFDSERALKFFDVASHAAALAGSELSIDVESLIAESLLRVGAFDQSLVRFGNVVRRSKEPLVQAIALSRVAWIHTQLDNDAAWGALRSAFACLGAKPPGDSWRALVGAVLTWAWWSLWRRRRVRDREERRRLEVVCALYYQAARLAQQTTRPLTLVALALRSLDPAERLGESPSLTKSYLMLSFVLTALGIRGIARRYLERAGEIATATRDPVVQAHVVQVHVVVAAWAGDIRDALAAGARALREYGHWRELSDFCMTAYNYQQMEGLRGKNLDAWQWLELAIQRANQHDGPPLALDHIEGAARATLASLGREADADRVLGRLRDAVLLAARWRASVVSMLGARVRLFTETGRLDRDFETLVIEVKKAKYDPRRVHMEVTEYYVHVAHARVHAALRASEVERQKCLAALRDALSDLERAARIPLLLAHCRVVQGYMAWFAEQSKKADKRFMEAEQLAEQEGAPWVLYAVHRGRAHMMRMAGREDDARDQAKLAETLALEHGAAHRARWIREEFGLRASKRRVTDASSSSDRQSVGPLSSSMSSSLSVRSLPSPTHLRSLTKIAEARPEELAPEQQSRTVLDEIVQALSAERGVLLFVSGAPGGDAAEDGASRLRVLVARTATAEDLPQDVSFDREMVENVFRSGVTEIAEQAPPKLDTPSRRASDHRRSMIAAAVAVQGTPIGVVYVDRPLAQGAFGEEDGERLMNFASQVPVALELARSLHVRERAFDNLRTAQKMEALSKLAGGVAHDFNNMLTVIFTLTEAILASKSRDLQADVTTIRSAAERARELTSQLLALSRGQFLSPRVVQLNDLVEKLEPTLKALLAPGVEVEVRLEPELYPVKVDPAQFEQVITNLAMNAGDAMPKGGRLIIETHNATLDEEYARLHPGVRAGRYAELTISDTGEGMDAATRQRIFEPFFTTKGQGKGTGLGLAMVYGIVSQSGGHIDVESNLGVGTVFRVYVPRSQAIAGSETPTPAPVTVPRGSETILVVDDEPLVRESLGRMLNRLGYTVLLAADGEEALRVASEHLDAIALVITDVLMPGMNGLELARELNRQAPRLKVLFVSGYTDGVLAERGILRERVDFIQKPLALAVLAARVREALDQP
jgi:eukaryotic-like serine/threonine-protein kinase